MEKSYTDLIEDIRKELSRRKKESEHLQIIIEHLTSKIDAYDVELQHVQEERDGLKQIVGEQAQLLADMCNQMAFMTLK